MSRVRVSEVDIQALPGDEKNPVILLVRFTMDGQDVGVLKGLDDVEAVELVEALQGALIEAGLAEGRTRYVC